MAYPDDYLYGGFKACVKRANRVHGAGPFAYNIRVNCVAPGATWVPKNDKVLSPFVKESIPLHRVGTPRENGEVVAFLASENASYITGITVRVDGGLILPGMLEGYDKIPWCARSGSRRSTKRPCRWSRRTRKRSNAPCTPRPACFRSSGPCSPSNATVLMHSSCKSLGPMENGADTLLDALTEHFSDGLVVLPTHTWATVGKRQPVYDVLEEPRLRGHPAGALPQAPGRAPAPGTRRTRSRPMARTRRLSSAGTKTAARPARAAPPGAGSTTGTAYALLVGVELNRMTFFHGVEEWANVPERVDTEHPLRLVIVPPEGRA